MAGQNVLLVFFKKLSFIAFMLTYFFLLSHFLVVEYYELWKSTILINRFSFFFKCLPEYVLCKIWCYLSWWYCTQLIMWKTIWLVATSCNLFHLICNLIHKNQNCWRIFLLFISYFLIFKCQDLVLTVAYLSTTIKSDYLELV